MNLEKKIFEGEDFEARFNAINQLDDQNLLFKIFRQINNYELEKIAFEKLNDQNILEQIAFEGHSDPNAFNLVHYTDAMHPKLTTFRFEAIEKLQSLEKKVELALYDVLPEIRMAALRTIKNEDIIMKIFRFHLPKYRKHGLLPADYLKYVRFTCIEQLTDQSKLSEIAMIDPVKQNQAKAVDKITDKKILLTLALNCEDGPLRLRIKEQIKELGNK